MSQSPLPSEQNNPAFFVPTVISKFKERITAPSSSVKDELCLSSSVRALSYLADVFDAEKRAPTDEELQLWDAWFCLRSANPAYGWIHELETDSDEIAAVWNDVLAKAAVLRWGVRLFPQNVLTIGTKDLLRTGKTQGIHVLSAALGQSAALFPARCEQVMLHEEHANAIAVSAEKIQPQPIKSGYNVILLPYAASDCTTFWAEPVRASSAVVRVIGKDGILGVLARENRSFSLSFDKSALLPTDKIANVLLGKSGNVLCFVAPEKTSALLSAISGAAVIGSITDGDKCALHFGNRNYALHTASIQKLCTTYKRHYSLQSGEVTVSAQFPVAIQNNDVNASCILPIPKNIVCQKTERSDKDLSYRAGIKDAVLSAFAAAAAGIRKDSMRMSLSLPTVNGNDETNASAIGYLLGLYRASQELLLPFDDAAYTETDSTQAALFAYGICNNKISDAILPVQSHLFFLNLNILQEETIPYASLRQSLRLLAQEIQNGHVCSAVPVTATAVKEVTAKHNVSLDYIDDRAATENCVTGLLLQCSDSVQWSKDFSHVGIIQQNEVPAAVVPPVKKQSDVFVKNPLAVILNFPGAEDNRREIHVLQDVGAIVRTYTVKTDDADSVNAVSAAVLHANVVLIHGDVPIDAQNELPHRLDYALKQVTKQGGLLFFTKAAARAAGFFGLSVTQSHFYQVNATERITVCGNDGALFTAQSYSVLKRKGDVLFDCNENDTDNAFVIRSAFLDGRIYADVLCDCEEKTWAFCSGMTEDDLKAAVHYFQ